ncbi:unnamed protein product [Dovyalis caffra]|uniref:Uncharacterized protein n=1 Tax=Dovyalis caffra TaxID=77055 RepID=A0AAV1RHB8_9ROSI|nr:unnamed protein product [Dovyalis caffra]
MNSSLYVHTAPCGLNYGSSNYSNSSLVTNYNYVTLGDMNASDLRELCSIEKIVLVPKIDHGNISFNEIREKRRTGLSFHGTTIGCENCARGCYLDERKPSSMHGRLLRNSGSSTALGSWISKAFGYFYSTGEGG